MGKKYRIKLKAGRIVGPLELQQVGELYEKGHLTGPEQIQNFPAGDWQSLKDNKEVASYLTRLAKGDQALSNDSSSGDSTVARISISKLKEQERKKAKDAKKFEQLKKVEELDQEVKKEQHQEFKFSREEKSEIVDYEELEEKYAELNENADNSEEDGGVEKTVVLKNPFKAPAQEDNQDKTIVNQEALKAFKELESIKAEKARQDQLAKEELALAQEEAAEEEVDFDESTQFIDRNALVQLKVEAKELERDIKIEEAKKEVEIKREKRKDKRESKKEEPEKKKISPIVALAFIVVIFFLLDEDEKKEVAFQPRYLIITAPITYEVMEEEKAERQFKLGLEAYRAGTYRGKLKATQHFLKSIEFKFNKNPALGFLILTYGELFKNVKNKSKGAAILFNLIKITRSRVFKDLNIAMGTALFYRNNGKIYSAINLIEKYLRVAKPSLKLLSLYLDLAIDTGDLVKARKVLEKLEKFPDRPLEVYLAMSKYYTLDEQYDEGKRVTIEGLKRFPSSVALLLDLSSYFLREENFKGYASTLKKVESLKYEGSPSYYAGYLENVGILSAYNKDVKTAAVLFQTALKISDSDSLRSKLAGLDVGGGVIAEKLILESKAIDLIRKSRKLIKERKWEEAFRVAIEAVDLENNFLPANLHLVNLQIVRGFYESAINTLNLLKNEFPTHPGVNFLLVKALAQANKIDDAQLHVNIISNSPLRQHPVYNSVVGHFYEKSGKNAMAIKFLNLSVGQNPLRDQDYYLMAKIYAKSRQYKESKVKLAEARTLDPLNIKYKSLYGEILFELEGADAAIGYLQTELNEYKDNARLMGDIATFFYRNGQIAQLKEVKEKVEKLRSNDPAFYDFLIRAAQIEENSEEVISNAKELIEINPGDVKTRMLLGRSLAQVGRYDEALSALDGVTKRLSTYPQVYYLKAKVYLKIKNYKKAMEAGEMEKKNNPKIYHGHYILGETERLIGKYSKATKNLERAISIEPRNVESLMSLGWIKLNQSRYDIARELYLRAKKKAPSNPNIRKQLAFIYQGIGQGGLAVEEFKTYLKLYPNAPDRTQIQNQIRTLSR
jgi:cytochrome c-type biogenesis protein CcmH/NrfG